MGQALPAVQKHLQSDHWRELRDENAPLRAVVNGVLISVPENFYDHILINNIPDEEIAMGRLIGNIIGNYPLGVSDGWYALRINKMIEDNRLVIVSDTDLEHPYRRVLKRG